MVVEAVTLLNSGVKIKKEQYLLLRSAFKETSSRLSPCNSWNVKGQVHPDRSRGPFCWQLSREPPETAANPCGPPKFSQPSSKAHSVKRRCTLRLPVSLELPVSAAKWVPEFFYSNFPWHSWQEQTEGEFKSHFIGPNWVDRANIQTTEGLLWISP